MKFDDVELAPDVKRRLAQSRRQLLEMLKSLLEEGEITEASTVAEVLQKLQEG
jgi:hypothetical protein